jgi:serine/threonine-protein kinase
MKLRARSRLGKYRIVAHRDSGGFAEVYEAFDTIERVRVALKVPRDGKPGSEIHEAYLKEVRLNATLEHPNILPIKNADLIDGRLVIAHPLGTESLADRLQRRMAVTTALELGHQILKGLAYAHARRVLHCDVKPENIILFPGNVLKLADFGLAKITSHTVRGSGSGTLGFMAPEHAMGRPSFRSDVFSAGLILYRMLSGRLPEWPFRWPLPGVDRLRRSVPRDFVELLKRSLHTMHRRRFKNAGDMLAAFEVLLPRVERFRAAQRRRKRRRT